MTRYLRPIAAALLTGSVLLQAQAQAQTQTDVDADALYQQYCAACHTAPDDVRTPARESLAAYTANSIFHSLTQGVMQPQAAMLDEEQIIALAEYLTSDRYDPRVSGVLARCEHAMPAFELSLADNWLNWGNGLDNARYQDQWGSRINAANADQLELVWAFGLEGATAVRAQPTVINQTMIFGSPSGTVYALDMHSGCLHWTFNAPQEVRGSIPLAYSQAQDRYLAVAADVSNHIHVLDARTGERLWGADVDDNRWARSTGSPVIQGNRVFVPVSSAEVSAAGRPDHHCCTFRGNLAAFDLDTGEKLWHTYVMEEAQQVGVNAIGNPVYAPSGAPIWQAPSVDPERRIVYAGTGQNYTRPASLTSDAVIAFDMDNGEMLWAYQTTEDDAFTMACTLAGDHPNCPDAGPDLDIGAPILPVRLANGRELVVAGTKGSVIVALDPDKGGELVWETRVGRGGALGGVHWGMTYVGDVLYVPVSDRGGMEGAYEAQPGLHAIDMNSGEVLWYAPAPQRCSDGERGCMNAYSAPASVSQDLVFSGSLSGVLFAHERETGALVWEFDSRRDFDTINGVEARGGSMDATGPVFSGDYMIVDSGYATFGQIPGNVMLVFRLPSAADTQ